jgi:hypothetical protein
VASNAVAHLCRRPRINLRIGAGGRAAGVARMAEQIGGAPQAASHRWRHLRAMPASMVRRFFSCSLSVAAEAIASTSWKVKYGTPSREKKSNAASSFMSAMACVTCGPSHGRFSVPPPKISAPGQLNECQ